MNITNSTQGAGSSTGPGTSGTPDPERMKARFTDMTEEALLQIEGMLAPLPARLDDIRSALHEVLCAKLADSIDKGVMLDLGTFRYYIDLLKMPEELRTRLQQGFIDRVEEVCNRAIRARLEDGSMPVSALFAELNAAARPGTYGHINTVSREILNGVFEVAADELLEAMVGPEGPQANPVFRCLVESAGAGGAVAGNVKAFRERLQTATGTSLANQVWQDNDDIPDEGSNRIGYAAYEGEELQPLLSGHMYYKEMRALANQGDAPLCTFWQEALNVAQWRIGRAAAGFLDKAKATSLLTGKIVNSKVAVAHHIVSVANAQAAKVRLSMTAYFDPVAHDGIRKNLYYEAWMRCHVRTPVLFDALWSDLSEATHRKLALEVCNGRHPLTNPNYHEIASLALTDPDWFNSQCKDFMQDVHRNIATRQVEKFKGLAKPGETLEFSRAYGDMVQALGQTSGTWKVLQAYIAAERASKPDFLPGAHSGNYHKMLQDPSCLNAIGDEGLKTRIVDIMKRSKDVADRAIAVFTQQKETKQVRFDSDRSTIRIEQDENTWPTFSFNALDHIDVGADNGLRGKVFNQGDRRRTRYGELFETLSERARSREDGNP